MSGRAGMKKSYHLDAATASQPRGALSGVRVLDFSHFIAGPFCTLLLGDLGADVIKVESIDGGDGFRRYPPHLDGEGVPYIWTNRNKRSIALNLKAADGVRIALKLADQADVVVENFSTGVMQRLGLGYEALRERNPRLVYCSVSAYGRHGPFAHRTGFDPIVQAESGLMSMIGRPDDEPMRTGPSIVDMVTSLMASNAILAALMARVETGRGQLVETNMIGTGINMLGNFSMACLATGVNPTRFGNVQQTASPVGPFDTAEGSVYISCANDRTFRRLVVDVLGVPQLAEDPRFLTSALRRDNRAPLFKAIGEILKKKPAREWLPRMHAVGVPAGEVRTVEAALKSPEVEALGLVGTIPHPQLGTVPNVALPFSLSETPLVQPTAAPMLGQHTFELLRQQLGYTESQIEALRANGAIAG